MPKEERIPITIRLKPSLLKAMRIAAIKADMSFAEWLEEFIRRGLKP